MTLDQIVTWLDRERPQDTASSLRVDRRTSVGPSGEYAAEQITEVFRSGKVVSKVK